MKAYKTMLSVVLAIMMLVTMIVPTWAEDPVTPTPAVTTGTITIDNAVVGQTYTIYEILELESYNAATNAYAYKATTAWKNFVESEAISGVYLDTEDGYVTWHQNLTCKNTETTHEHTDACYTKADAAAFAKLAQAWAKANISYTTDTDKAKFIKTANTTTVEFTDLNLGYYLVDTTLGTLCSLNTTKPTVTIQEKNVEPTNEKKVQEDSKVDDTDKGWGSSNDADIGQTVNFQSTITAQAGAENYVFHDKMSAGLTYGSVTGITLNGTTVAISNYTVKTTGLTDGCTFEVVFTQTFCDTLKANDRIVISYTATVNNGAVVGLPGNDNESKVSYGDSTNTKYTTPSKTTTYTWDMDVLKYANGKEADVLSGAQFVLIKKKSVDDSENPGQKKLVDDKVAKFASVYKKDSDGKDTEEIVSYKFDSWVELPASGATWETTSILTTNANGKIEIDGLDSDTYYLREIKAPDGYNMLKDDVTVEIEGAETKEEDGKPTLLYTTVVAKVNNQSGTELPSTGGIGTTIFYCAGAILALGAFVLLVTKKRMGRE